MNENTNNKSLFHFKASDGEQQRWFLDGHERFWQFQVINLQYWFYEAGLSVSEKHVCLFSSSLLTVTLLDSRGSLWEAGVCSTAHPGALRSAGDAEEIPPAGVRTVELRERPSLCSWTQSLVQHPSSSASPPYYDVYPLKTKPNYSPVFKSNSHEFYWEIKF